MRLLPAFLFSVLLIIASSALGVVLDFNTLPALVVIGTSVWVYTDAKKLRLSDYRTGLMNAEIATIGCFLMWIIAFPWYLSTRYKIMNGQLRPARIPADDERDRWRDEYPR
jgi:uncharacterized membrane protein YqgA involved in biofilm formation